MQSASEIAATKAPAVEVRGLTMAFGARIVQHDLNCRVTTGEVFVIMGGSGSGKSTLLRHMIGLQLPLAGEILYHGRSFLSAAPEEQQAIRRCFGVMYQGGALWSSMTLAENVSLPLEEHTTLPPAAVRDLAALKLALVGLAGFEDFHPSEISGGMRKRAAIARAMALDPEIVYLDEPSAGLDPLTARRLDDLVLELRASLGMTFVVVTHELASIFAIADDSIFLDADRRTMIACGNPRRLIEEENVDPTVRAFLTRGGAGSA
jgi:phospholipid/cholesterol/gamma-HCH transport system ATP-binding protein